MRRRHETAARRRRGAHFAAVALGAMALGLGASAASAQRGELRGALAGYLGVGASAVAMGELDDRLAARGYPTFGRGAVGVNVGAYLTLSGGMMLGGEWHGLILGEEEHQGREVGIGGGYGTLGIAYPFEVAPRVRVYPRLGLGGGGFGLWIERDGEAVPFDEALADPEAYAPSDSASATGEGFSMNRGGVVVDVGGGVELRPGGPGLGLLIGVRFGWVATPFSGEWHLGGRPVTGGPDASIAGPYLRLVVGGETKW